MIKETDASTCDERRVKNKPEPLTHKKKGETHIMGNQGMKIWKLGTFFVISLMLMAGLFTNTASALTNDKTVSVSHDEVTSEDTIDLAVTHTFSSRVTLDDTGTYEIVISIPDWDAADGNSLML